MGRPRKEVVAADDSQQPQTKSSDPSWKAQHGRVQGAMWQHPQDGGKIRRVTSISRFYLDRKANKWESVHYYDEDDLDNVIATATEAKAQIQRLKDLAQLAGEE